VFCIGRIGASLMRGVMRTNRKGLVLVGVLVEAVLCFWLVRSSALLGLLLVPFWFRLIVNYDPVHVAINDPGRFFPLIAIGQAVLGVLGLAGVTRLLYLIVAGPNRRWRKTTLLCVAAGMLSVVWFGAQVGLSNVFGEPYVLLTVLVLPMGGSLHLLYLARRALF
jgi:hypothetical protein